MAIERQIGKHYDREATVQAINSKVVLLNKHVQRMMYHIQIEGLELLTDNSLGSLKIALEQVILKLENHWVDFYPTDFRV